MPTVTSSSGAPADTGLVDARLTAADSAARSGVVISELLDPVSQADARSVFDEVWPAEDGSTQVRANLMRALDHAGGYCVAAYDEADGAVLGATLAFLGRAEDGTTVLHSHMSAVIERVRDRHIGTAMKQHQRAWAWTHGVPVITWTFDPLVRRNAYINVCKLGIEVRGYHEDFYGPMHDAINAGDPSDRLVAWWSVRSRRAEQAAAGSIAPTCEESARDQGVRLVATPDDIVSLRRSDPALARRWRLQVRAQLQEAFAEGLAIEGMTDLGAYVLGEPVDR